MPWVGAVHGFWTNFDNSNTTRCVSTGSSNCGAANLFPAPPTVTAGTLISDTGRDVNNWGAAFELTTPQETPMLLPGLFKNTHWGAGFDVRGLDQKLHINGTGGSQDIFQYRETLDATYYGGYLTFGGEYSLFPNLYSSWGLRSFADAHVGVYGVNTDYNGRFFPNGLSSVKLDLSKDDVAVIAGLNSRRASSSARGRACRCSANMNGIPGCPT